MPTALVTGITGQDGSYLAELLLSKGYQVHGFSRSLRRGLGKVEHLHASIALHTFPPHDAAAWDQLIAALQPQEVYHLAADSFVPNGWTDPIGNVQANLTLTARILESIRKSCPTTKFLNACSREVFGNCAQQRADESTPMQPTTPYGINKAASRWLAESYREKYRIFTANAILFNHESPRRPVSFVTRKISRGVAEITLGLSDEIQLGNLQARRDWGFAGDFVDGLWRTLQIDEPQDFIFGTGITYSIEQFAELAFQVVGLHWRDHVKTAPALRRTQENSFLAANGEKAERLLHWRAITQVPELVRMMVDHDVETLQTEMRSRRAA